MHPEVRNRARIAFLGGLFIVAALFELAILRPFTSASIGPDAAAPVVHFLRITSGQHLEGFLGQTPKPLLTLVYGLIYSVFHDWRPIAWAAVAVFALCVVLGGVLGYRLASYAGGAFVAIGLLFSSVLLADLTLAYSVSWALLGWLVAGLAVTAKRPRYEIAGLALMLASLARLETLIVILAAAASLVLAEIMARRTHRPGPPRAAYLVLLGFLALPIMLVHDWLLTGDPFFWATISQLNSVGAPNIRGPVQVAVSLGLHFVHGAPILPLAALGAFVLVRRRLWPLVVGLLALGPGVALFLVYLGARSIFVSNRYLAAIDLSLLVTAGVGLSAVDLPAIRRLVRRFRPLESRRAVLLVVAGALTALALAPVGLLDSTTRRTISRQIQLHANEQRAMAAIRAELAHPSACLLAAGASGVPLRSAVIVPSHMRAQAVVDLGLPLTQVAKPGGITKLAGEPAPGQIVYHDRLDGEAASRYAIFEIDHPVVAGADRLVPLLSDPVHGAWVVLIESAICP